MSIITTIVAYNRFDGLSLIFLLCVILTHTHTHTNLLFFFWLCFLSKVINYVFGFFYCYVFNIVEENEIDDYDSDDHLRSSWWWWQNIYEFSCYAMYIMQINIRIFPSRSFFFVDIFLCESFFCMFGWMDGWMNRQMFFEAFFPSLYLFVCMIDRYMDTVNYRSVIIYFTVKQKKKFTYRPLSSYL